ncbi:Queuine tRNA-ribosyltransferase [Frankliniella fusca]|uniref:Queuine tRNA-ribosyltransferase n=1 Tax=Frankliniella fusca TaxID=407009 RepID=A0AAE1HZG3_9NEOP|nr:Queuine tRNA-ribosyltransferase [Frankliniella fusca]
MEDHPPDPPELSAAKLLQREAAYVLSHIRDTCKTSQKATDAVVAGVDKLLNLFLNVLNDKFNCVLSNRDGYIKLEEIKAVLDRYKRQSIFEGVSSKPYLEAYIQKESAGNGVSLQKVVLESKTVIREGKPWKIPTKFGYRVPFLPQLEQLLQCKDVMDCVKNPVPSQKGVYKSVTDGLFSKYHPVHVQSQNTNKSITLVFTAHVDDVDPCDALKSKSGNQNLRLFYWVLANIPPEKRSTLKAVNLLAIVKSKIAKKKGNVYFMQDFIDTLKKMGTEGIELTINTEIIRIFAILLFIAADYPAAANLGGFKETHFALRPCRVCTVKSGEMCEHFCENLALLRKLVSHRDQVKKVLASNNQSEESSNIEVMDIDIDTLYIDDNESEDKLEHELPLDHVNPSTNFGINGRCILDVLPGFDETKCFPQDPLHLLAEGVVERVCRLVLRDLCIALKVPGKRIKPLLSLDVVNDVIQNVSDLGHLNSSKPSIILKEHIAGKKLRQSGSQMLVLLNLLPFIINGVCPQEKN